MSRKTSMSYIELNDTQKTKADELHYLLGKSIHEKVFILINDQISAVNTIAADHRYPRYGYFCTKCQKGFRKNDIICEHGGFPVRTKTIMYFWESAKTMRQQYNEAKFANEQISERG